MKEAKVETSLKELGEKALASKVNLDYLLPIIGDKLEREALEKFRHNEEWAIRGVLQDSWRETEPSAWEQLKEKFRQEIAQELTPEQLKEFPTEDILDGLPSFIEDYIIGMVRLYQKESFDPLANYMRRLELKGASEHTLQNTSAIIARFVGKYGRKRRYGDEEIQEFLYSERKRLNDNSYQTRYMIMKSFLKSLPDGGQELHVPKPKKSKEPPKVAILTAEEIETLIVSAFVDREPIDLLARLLLCTVYGCRAGEVADFSGENVDLERMAVMITTEKGGEVKPQTLPQGLQVFFSNGVKPVPRTKLWPQLRRLLRNAGIEVGTYKAGGSRNKSFHAIRRGVVTALDDVQVDGLSIYEWLRWAKGRQFGMLPTYIKTKPGERDKRVLEKHPFVPIWQRLAGLTPYLQYANIDEAS